MGVVMFAKADREQLAAAWRAGEHIYTAQRSPLYAALSKAGAEDADILELSSHALGAAPPVHLFISAHYLLLGGVEHPLARFFPTLTADPAPPGEAWPHFRAFCQEHREALTSLLQTRSVQMTYVERCRVLMPAMSLAGQMAGAPMHIVELGCSAGIMLIFDKYSYEMRPGEVVGPADAEIRLKGELHGGAKLEMPQILSRTGIDLNLIDPHSADDRRWMLATCFPELLGEQQRLARAIDLVAETDIRWFEGDALGHVSRVLAETPDPVCLYHSACLMYWSAEAKAELERQLLEASKGRTILRVAVEAGEKFDRWQAGASKPNSDPGTAARATGEIVVTRYRNGEAEGRIVANSTSDYATVYWLD
jgi:hypothetical protein